MLLPQSNLKPLMDSFQTLLRGVWWLPMAATNASSLTEGLKSKLYSSSLPLEARCRLATNVITCRVAVPHREELVLEWVISSLRKKYLRQCEGQRKDEKQLWICLAACHPYLPITLDYSQVPDFFLDV